MADATIVSRLVDGTVVVAHAGRVRRAQLTQTLANLDRVSGRILGVVLNRVRVDVEPYTYQSLEADGPQQRGTLMRTPVRIRDGRAGGVPVGS